jgi:hypothetical protein
MKKRQAPEENPGGQDLIVGQNADSGQSRKRTCTLRRKKNSQEFEAPIEVEDDWVIPTGGGYFFTPSIAPLREVIGAWAGFRKPKQKRRGAHYGTQ